MGPRIANIGIRELDHRKNDGIEVRLLWNASTRGVSVSVAERNGGCFEFEVHPADALEAFRHPYAYVASSRRFSVLAA